MYNFLTELKNENKIITSPDFDKIYIPIKLQKDKRFSIYEKIYIAMYYQYSSNEYYADMEMLDIVKNRKSLLYIKRKLKQKGFFIDVATPQKAKEIVLENKNKGGTCDWCGCRTFALQEHHFPIPKSKGGKDIVKICPNCHYEYHKIYKGGI